MSAAITLQNFVFLRAHEPQLDRLGALAERYFADDPETCLIKHRQFAELLARQVAARNGLAEAPIFAEHEPTLDARLADCNAALAAFLSGLALDLQAKLACKQKTEGKRSITDADRRRWLLPPANRDP